MPRPNILYLHSHDTGRYISPYGHDVPTPNLQRLAEEGVLFRPSCAEADVPYTEKSVSRTYLHPYPEELARAI